MLQTIALLAGLAAVFLTISAQLHARSGSASRDVGVIPNGWDVVAATHAAQAPFTFGPPAPAVEIINLSAHNRIHLSTPRSQGSPSTQCST